MIDEKYVASLEARVEQLEEANSELVIKMDHYNMWKFGYTINNIKIEYIRKYCDSLLNPKDSEFLNKCIESVIEVINRKIEENKTKPVEIAEILTKDMKVEIAKEYERVLSIFNGTKASIDTKEELRLTYG